MRSIVVERNPLDPTEFIDLSCSSFVLMSLLLLFAYLSVAKSVTVVVVFQQYWSYYCCVLWLPLLACGVLL